MKGPSVFALSLDNHLVVHQINSCIYTYQIRIIFQSTLVCGWKGGKTTLKRDEERAHSPYIYQNRMRTSHGTIHEVRRGWHCAKPLPSTLAISKPGAVWAHFLQTARIKLSLLDWYHIPTEDTDKQPLYLHMYWSHSAASGKKHEIFVST